MKRTGFIVWLLASLLMLATLVAVVPRLKVESDLLAMLPAEARDPLAEAASATMTQNLSRQLLVLVGHESLTQARAAASAYVAPLQASGLFASLRLEVTGAALQPAPTELAHRYLLLSAEDHALLASGNAAELQQQALAALYSPSGFARITRIADDPLGLYERFLQQSLPVPGKAGLEAGVLTLHHGGKVWVLLLAQLRDSPFAYRQQEPLSAALLAARTAATKAGASVQLSGVAPHALRSAARAQAEMGTLGTASTVATLLLLWTVFGALRPTLLALLSMALGIAGGVLACHFAFGSVHLMTLVFGSSLVGIAVDYALHFLCDQFRSPQDWQPTQALDHVGKGLLMGLATTILGYVAFATAPMPVLRQMALFSSAGLTVAYACVRWGFPTLAARTPLRASSRGWMRLALRLRPHRLHWAFWALLVLLGIGGLTKLRFADDLRLLQSSNPQLMAEEAGVREKLGALADRRFFLVTGPDAEAVLQTEEALTARLHALRAQGALAGWQAVSRAVPSAARQTADRALIAPLYAPGGAVAQQMSELGFAAEAITAQAASFASAAPFTVEQALQSPRLAPLSPLWLGKLEGATASLVIPTGITDEPAVQAAVQGLKGVQWRDPVAEITHTLGEQRRTAQWRMVGVYALTVGLLVLIYGWRAAPRFIFPSLGASLLTLAVLGWLGIAANLFTMLALLLVLGMGVDYAIFLRDTAKAPISSRLGVTVAALTTLFSFGGLAFSATPFLRAIGLTLTLGIALSLVLALLTAESTPSDR